MGALLRIVPPRGFKYKPRFYNPDDEGEASKRRLNFRHLRRYHQWTGRPIAVWIFLAVISFYLYWRFNHKIHEGAPWQVESLQLQENDQ